MFWIFHLLLNQKRIFITILKKYFSMGYTQIDSKIDLLPTVNIGLKLRLYLASNLEICSALILSFSFSTI